MPGLDPGIHAVTTERVEAPMEWIAGSSPAMTGDGRLRQIEGALFPAITELLDFPDRRDGPESLIPLVRLQEFCHFEDE
jgi:hypothetical protein